MDITRVSFVIVFRIGKEETQNHEHGTYYLKGCPVLCNKTGRIWTPIALADEVELNASCGDILFVGYVPIESAKDAAAKSNLGSVHPGMRYFCKIKEDEDFNRMNTLGK